MDDTACRDFFARPTHPYHRRYEALRAVFVEGRPPKEVAAQFGLAHRSVRQLVYEFRQHCRHSSDASPFFDSRKWGDLPGRRPPIGLLTKRSRQLPIAASWSCRRANLCG
jgi:hypothetical protein